MFRADRIQLVGEDCGKVRGYFCQIVTSWRRETVPSPKWNIMGSKSLMFSVEKHNDCIMYLSSLFVKLWRIVAAYRVLRE